mgnify:FL=1
MIVKKAGGKVYGAVFTAAEKKAMEMEINRQIIEADKRYTDDIDAMVLYTLAVHLALALSGSDAFMKHLPQSMTGLFNITKCRTITHGSAKKN